MNASISLSDLVYLAYRLLKQNSCYDKMDLFLRANVAGYEAGDSFQQRQDALATIVVELRKGTPTLKSRKPFKAWRTQNQMAKMFRTSK